MAEARPRGWQRRSPTTWLAEAIRARIGRERFRELPEFAISERFSAREKAALTYAHADQSVST